MTFLLSQGLLDLPENSGHRSAEAQTVPKPEDFVLSIGVHDVHSGIGSP
jgi:hypothetical protein